MLKGLNDFLDKHEGRKIGSSTKAILKERKAQGYDKRKNTTPYVSSEKPKANSDYFGKSYGQQMREAKSARAKSNALDKTKAPSIDKKEYKGITKALKGAMKD